MEQIIQIPNGTHQMAIQISDPNTLYLAIGTFALVRITLFGILLSDSRTRRSITELRNSNELTRQSNDLLITEIESEFRPIISRHVYQKKKYHRSQINDDTCSITPEKIMFHIINSGRLPAIEVSYKYYIERRSQPSKMVKLKPTGTNISTPLSSLAPSEYYSIDIPLTEASMFKTIKDDVQCYFDMIIWYSDENRRRYCYHMEGFFQRSALMLNHVDMRKFS